MVSASGSLASLLRDPKYSDLKICCDSRDFAVHRVIVCSASKVLARECDGAFEESRHRVIDHRAFPASTVWHMLQFIYGGAYDVEIVHVTSPAAQDHGHPSTDSGTRGVVVRSNATHPTAPVTIRAAQEDGHPSTDSGTREVVIRSNAAQSTVPAEPTYVPDESTIGTDAHEISAHVKVYAIADYYDVQGLKSVALENFRHGLPLVEDEDFIHVVRAAYTNTVCQNDSLRMRVVEETLRRAQMLMENERFTAVLSKDADIQHFIADLVLALQRDAKAKIESLQVALAVADEDARSAQLRSSAKHEALVQTSRLTEQTRNCRNCGIDFGSYLDGTDRAATLDRACFLRCRGCKCKHKIND